MTHEYILKQVSPYTGEPHVLYQKEFESSKHAEMYLKPLLEKIQAVTPPLALCYRRGLSCHTKSPASFQKQSLHIFQ